MEFRILGPVELWTAEKQHNLGSAKERCLLAILLLARGRPVTIDTLVDRVWGDEPPAEVAQSLHVDLSRLRRRLRSAASREILRRAASHSYVLDVGPEEVDVFRSFNYRVQGQSVAESGAYEEASRLLHRAESLWCGEPLAGLAGAWVERARVALSNDYRALALELVSVDLKLGRHSELIGFLLELLDRYPLDEAIIEQLILAYYRCSRQVDAVDLYLRTKDALAEDGLLPEPRLREIHRGVVAHDPALRFVREPIKASVPADDLPQVIADFTGRSAEMTALTGSDAPNAGIISIVGMPGVGKTSLAIKMASELAPAFPDAQVYLDLHAHDDRQRPVDTATALPTLLMAVGVAPSRIPRSLAEQSRLLRNELIGRRVLILLDDAESAEQIRPLLPETPDCMVIITSRRTLDELAVPGRKYKLGVLSMDDAISLFTRITGRRSPLSRDDAAEVARLCDRLPLAIRLAATRVRDQQVPSVNALIREMRDVRDDVNDQPYPELSAAFSLSYRDLNRHQQYVFRMIGLSPVAELSAANVAALASISSSAANETIEQLVANNLLLPVSPSRFRCHDLIRLYARSRSRREDGEPTRRKAVSRSLDHYLRVTDHADRVLHPYRGRIPGQPELPPQNGEVFSGRNEAQAWLADEWRNIYNLIHYCAEHGHSSHAIRLADTAAGFLDSECHWQEARIAHRRTLRIARELELAPEVAQTRLNLAVIHWRLGDMNRALKDAHIARSIHREVENTEQEAAAFDRIGLILWSFSDYGGALAYFEEASEKYREINHAHGEANCLGHKGMGLFYTGRYREAIDTYVKTLDMYRALNDPRGQAITLNNLGDARLRLGDHREAERLFTSSKEIYDSISGKRNGAILQINFGNVARYRRETRTALDLYRRARKECAERGDRINEANVLNGIGFALTDDEQFQEALGHYRVALRIADEIGNRFEKARALLGRADAENGNGRYAAAFHGYQASCGIAREIGDPYLEALALSGLAKVTEHSVGFDAARIYWRQARDILSQLGELPELAEVQVRLERIALLPPQTRRRIELTGQTGEWRIR